MSRRKASGMRSKPSSTSSLKRSFPACCQAPRCFSASLRRCHQSNTRNPWMLARVTIKCPMKRFADVGFAELAGESHAAANDDPRADAEVFHDRVVDWACGVVEEHIDPLRTCLLDRCRKVSGFSVVDDRVVTDLAAPLQLVVV